MLTITAQKIEEADFTAVDVGCQSVDFATIAQAQRSSDPGFAGCELDVAWVVFMKPAEDITIPIFICSVHFNAFKFAVSSGRVGVDLDIFGDIS